MAVRDQAKRLLTALAPTAHPDAALALTPAASAVS
jgi:hypothetical protein